MNRVWIYIANHDVWVEAEWSNVRCRWEVSLRYESV